MSRCMSRRMYPRAPACGRWLARRRVLEGSLPPRGGARRGPAAAPPPPPCGAPSPSPSPGPPPGRTTPPDPRWGGEGGQGIVKGWTRGR
eukprot:1860559-Pyramimonas_sp.AAC.2